MDMLCAVRVQLDKWGQHVFETIGDFGDDAKLNFVEAKPRSGRDYDALAAFRSLSLMGLTRTALLLRASGRKTQVWRLTDVGRQIFSAIYQKEAKLPYKDWPGEGNA